MTATELMQRYSMEAHIENGAFVECHYKNDLPGRAASGSIYYYVAPGERTEFHRIDCDEYWSYAAGAPLELWQIDAQGRLSVCRIGIGPDCEPTVFFKSGVIFASRSLSTDGDGTFLTCVTVPRFSYDGFKMYSREEMLRLCPETAAFFAAGDVRSAAPIVIEGAMDCEISAVMDALCDRHDRDICGYPVAVGSIDGRCVVAARTKIGMINAAILTKTLIDTFRPSCVISQGTAGSHRRSLHSGDIVLGENIRTINCAHMDSADCRQIELLSSGEWEEMLTFKSDSTLLEIAAATPYAHGKLVKGTIASGDFWSHGEEEIGRISRRYGSDCEEMETFSAAQTCARMGVPFLGLRVLSNNELTGEDFDANAALFCQNYTLDVVKAIIAADS